MKTASVCCAVVLIVGLVATGIYLFPVWLTKSALQRESQLVLNAMYREEQHVPGIDAWGMPIANHVETGREAIVIRVVSAGRDQTMGTADDQHFEKLDLNKSYLLSRWAGSKVKEAGKGIVDGLKQKSPFKDN